MCFYINLSHRKDRREEIEKELIDFQLPFERFEAYYTPELGALGCAQSHLAVLKIAKDRNYENIIIFEDDFTFLVSKEEFEKQLQQFFNLDIVFGGCLLSYNLFQYQKTNYDFLYRIIDASTMSGYIVNKRCYERFIRLLEYSNPLLAKTKQDYKYACDVIFKNMQKKGYWFGFSKRIGKQRKSYSDIEKCEKDYQC
jgi:glycosyl transferase family 25